MALAAGAGIPLDVMYDVVTMSPEIPGCSKTGCVMWWMAITPRIQPSIFLLRILVWLPDTAKALHFPSPLASIVCQYVHQRQ